MMSYQGQNATREGDSDLWQSFAEEEALSPEAVGHFKAYADLLEEWHKRMNLTTILGTKNIIRHHFQDSLHLSQFIDLNGVKTVCDIGSGGGFPGLPLKIKFPHLQVILMEVNNKKIQFLEAVINQLGLKDVVISPLDWRTFLRTTEYDIDLFCARASLHTDELIRLFKPGCRYREAKLVYWASDEWRLGQKEAPYVKSEYAYTIGSRKRRYILFEI